MQRRVSCINPMEDARVVELRRLNKTSRDAGIFPHQSFYGADIVFDNGHMITVVEQVEQVVKLLDAER